MKILGMALSCCLIAAAAFAKDAKVEGTKANVGVGGSNTIACEGGTYTNNGNTCCNTSGGGWACKIDGKWTQMSTARIKADTNKPCPDGQKPPCGTPGLNTGKVAAAAKKPAHPVVGDPNLIAGAKVIGPKEIAAGTGGATNLTENKCQQNGCTVVCGQGPSYATWCRCGGTGAQTFTYIHD